MLFGGVRNGISATISHHGAILPEQFGPAGHLALHIDGAVAEHAAQKLVHIAFLGIKGRLASAQVFEHPEVEIAFVRWIGEGPHVPFFEVLHSLVEGWEQALPQPLGFRVVPAPFVEAFLKIGQSGVEVWFNHKFPMRGPRNYLGRGQPLPKPAPTGRPSPRQLAKGLKPPGFCLPGELICVAPGLGRAYE